MKTNLIVKSSVIKIQLILLGKCRDHLTTCNMNSLVHVCRLWSTKLTRSFNWKMRCSSLPSKEQWPTPSLPSTLSGLLNGKVHRMISEHRPVLLTLVPAMECSKGLSNYWQLMITGLKLLLIPRTLLRSCLPKSGANPWTTSDSSNTLRPSWSP